MTSLGMATPTFAAKPRINWTLGSAADAGTPMKFSWTARGLTSKHRLVVQRRTGTAGVWRSVRSLPREASGSAQLPGLALGTYRLRIIVRNAKRKVLAENARTVRVYGQVALVTLVGRPPQVYTTPTNTFVYVLSNDVGATPASIFTSSKPNPCRSVHLDFVPGEQPTSAPTGVVSVVQETLDPVTVSSPHDTKGALDAPLVPGRAWSINAASSGVDAVRIHINGFASCSAETLLW